MGGVEVQLHAFLTSARNRDEWLGSCNSCFTQVARAICIHGIGGWVGLSAGQDMMAKKKIYVPAGNRTPVTLIRFSQSTLWNLKFIGTGK
jgi:hypothetical protein